MEPGSAVLNAKAHVRARANPYVGLRPFKREDSQLFFGRREQTIALLALLEESRFLPVLGSSGSGKSSLVRAGLVPALCGGFLVQDRDQWSIATMTPGDAPLDNLALALLAAARADAERSDGLPDLAAVAALAKQLEVDPFDAASRAIEAQLGPRRNLLLVVDQFEEIFAFRGKGDPAQRAEADDFVALLLELAEDRSLPVYVVLTMRSDFAGDCDVFHGLPEAMNRTRYLVPRLRRDQLRQAIEGPALLEGVKLAPRLLDRLLNEMGDRSDQLPVLQHALQRTWHEWSQQKDAPPVLEQQHYEDAGMLDGALRKHADEALAQVDRKLAALLFRRLTDTDVQGRRVRRATSFGDLRTLAKAEGFSEQQVEQALQAFWSDGRHFVHVGPAASVDERRVDISHESLIRQWPVLRDWVDKERAERDQFRELIARNERHERGGRLAATLMYEADLASAAQWLTNRDVGAVWATRYAAPGVFEAVNAYVRSSSDAADRRQRVMNVIGVAVGVGLVVLAVVITWLWIDARSGEEAAVEAQRSAEKAWGEVRTTLALNLAEQGRDALQDGDSRAAASTLARAYQHAADLPQIRLMLPRALALGAELDAAVLTSTKSKPVNRARFSADGTRVVTASDDGTARVWEVPSGRAIATLSGHSGLVTDAVFGPAGDAIVTASADGTVRLWDARTGQARATLLRDQASIVAIAFRGADPLALTLDGEERGGAVRVWTLVNAGNPSAQPAATTLTGVRGAVTSAAVSPDGQLIVTVDNGRPTLWNAINGELHRGLQPPDRTHVHSAEFTADGAHVVGLAEEVSTLTSDPAAPKRGVACVWPARGAPFPALVELVFGGQGERLNGAAVRTDGELWVTAGSDHTARVWDKTGTQLALLVGHEDQVLAARFSPDGELIATVSRDETARLWYARTGHPIAELPGHTDSVTDATFSPDGKYLLTMSHDGSARLWNIEGARAAAILRGHEAPLTSASFSPDGARAVTAGEDGTARIWNARTGGMLTRVRHDGAVRSASFSPDGLRLVTASADATVAVWDVATAKRVHRLAHSGPVTSAAFSPDGTRILSVSDESSPHLWDARSGQRLLTLEPQPSSVQAASFSPDGARILTLSDGKVRVWDATTGAVLAAGLGEEVDVAAFAPDGTALVTGAYEATTTWQAPSWKALPKIDDGEVTALAFDPKGTRLLVAHRGWARILDTFAAAHPLLAKVPPFNERMPEELKGHRGAIRHACFSPNGAWAITASEDLTTRVWDARTGQVLLTFEGHQQPITALACSPDGTRLLSASADHTARLWDISLETRAPEQIMKLVQKLPDALRNAVPASD